ncbi:MAG: Uncharacterised protein [Puniceicoccaceae bacterium MED-G32]|jgi:hypothetical protein|nr:hypothetical protein [Puniceicoccaceae bacterium]CAI8264255.1 MAG: Uncharacterised protein [Puniceicoccaceae bacterium MED-G32]|tara:strand:- start:7910 stop:8155 length:246 start_codon:yes stop_codon:yes gene_type:complete
MTNKSSDIEHSLDSENTYLDNDFMHNSSVYREFLAERNEILKHKWLESEKVGNDIGFEKALLDWIQKHRSNWRNFRKNKKA